MFKEDLLLLTKRNIEQWNSDFVGASPQQVLSYFAGKFDGHICFASSMGMEDQVITEMLSGIEPRMRVFTLDTGRLFQETCDLIQITGSRYNINIEVFFPDAEKVESMVNQHGINLFYESAANRKLCCRIRKIEPLARALKGMNAWVTGIRKEQATTRQDHMIIEWDENNGLIKINPLIDWSEADVLNYINEKNIPINTLHAKGFKSIGCLPCTRAVTTGEDPRAGRWWWENKGHKECGLHYR